MSTINDNTEPMTETNGFSVSKSVKNINRSDITDLSERIAGTETLLNLHEQIRDNYKRDYQRLSRSANKSLNKGYNSVQASLDHMDKSLEVQRKMVDENDQVAKFARELLELIEERQAAIRSMVEQA